MLQTLNIENVALIDKATLNFDKRLNVISGETGAGKSILLDSLSFVFGGRADRSLIRSGSSFMRVEAIFSSISYNQIKFINENFNIDCSDELFISRELDLNGRNTCKVNGEYAPVATVKKICQLLVDVHGQSEHLSILDNNFQLNIIDIYGKTPEEYFNELKELISQLKENEKEIKLLGGDEHEKQNLIDLYKYQISEIESANIKENEFEELLNEKKEMTQFEKINNALQMAGNSLSKSGFEESAIEKIIDAKKLLQSIESVNQNYSELFNRIDSCLIEIQDIVDTIDDSLDNIVFDQARFDYVDKRIDLLKTLFRKYGGDYQNLINYYNEISKKLDNLLNSSEKYEKLLKNCDKILKDIGKLQNQISEYRQKSAAKFVLEMEKELKVLGMSNAKIDVEFKRVGEEYTEKGFDFVEFMFSANLGFELKPLNKVVSGGEMSRVMLAYKIVLSSLDEIHTVVFDEIDSGLSGNVAFIVAEYMARLSVNKQVLAVSHLPQICAMADQNVKVEKHTIDNNTKTELTILTGNDLLVEISRLMGSGEDENAALMGLKLKEKSNKYKENLKNI